MAEHLAPVFVNKKPVKELDDPKPTVFEVIKKSGRDPEKCDVFLLKSEDDEEGQRIELTAVLDRTISDKPIFLRCVPKDRNVGDGVIPPRLVDDAESLRQTHYSLDLKPESSRVYAEFHGFRLPKNRFNKGRTELLVVVPLPYPDAKIDMFYTEPDLSLINGGVPKGAEVIESHLGRNWRRFSWHTNSWNPAVDDLASHVSFIEQRLHEVD
jgi:Prokaryotic E2 family E